MKAEGRLNRQNNNYHFDRVSELQANQYAADFLMPEAEVSILWPRFKSVIEMANIFEVSVVAMEWRLKNLDLM